MLYRLNNEGWPQDLLEKIDLDDEVLEFAITAMENMEVQVVLIKGLKERLKHRCKAGNNRSNYTLRS